MRSLIVLLATVIAGSSGATAQETQQIGPPTLPQLARRVAPNPLHQVAHVEHVVEAVETMVPEAHLIVCGTVTAAQTHLSDNERDLETYYSFRPDRVIVQQPIAGQPTVDTTSTITVEQWGGQMTIEGVEVTLEDDELRSLQVGERLVLFLEYDPESATFNALSVAALWAVTGAGVAPIMKHPDPLLNPFRGMTLDQFAAALQGLAP